MAQAARRGDAPQFLSICHVLEFEPIYRYEALKREVAGKGADGSGGRGPDSSYRTIVSFLVRLSRMNRSRMGFISNIRQGHQKIFYSLSVATSGFGGPRVQISIERKARLCHHVH